MSMEVPTLQARFLISRKMVEPSKHRVMPNGKAGVTEKASRKRLKDLSPIDINLCAGAGGMALGLARAGFTPCEFYDKDADASETLRRNMNSPPYDVTGHMIEGDLSAVEWLASNAEIRLLAVGTPCQPFSNGGSRRGHEDERNLFPMVLDAVRRLRPRAVLIENVRGLGGAAHKPYLDYIRNQLRFPNVAPQENECWEYHSLRLERHCELQSAYNVKSAVLNAADFGVPQIRHRLFIVATANDLSEYAFPKATHSKRKLFMEQATGDYWQKRGLSPAKANGRSKPKCDEIEGLLPWVTVRDAIEDLPQPASEEVDDCNNHWTIPGARTYPGHTGSHLDWPSKTLKAGVHGVPGGENIMIPEDGIVRYYTLREMARIQSFPDSHYFLGSRSSVIRQIGNAVPSELAFCVARPLWELFDGD